MVHCAFRRDVAGPLADHDAQLELPVRLGNVARQHHGIPGADHARGELDEAIGVGICAGVHHLLDPAAALVLTHGFRFGIPHGRIAHDQPDDMLLVVGASAEDLTGTIRRADIRIGKAERAGERGFVRRPAMHLRQRRVPIRQQTMQVAPFAPMRQRHEAVVAHKHGVVADRGQSKGHQ